MKHKNEYATEPSTFVLEFDFQFTYNEYGLVATKVDSKFQGEFGNLSIKIKPPNPKPQPHSLSILLV